MNFKHVLIVTYGRSGSTLLQGLLNSIDGYLVRGENYNACYGLFLAYKAFHKAKKEFGRGDKSLSPTWPWYGASCFDDGRFIEDARTLLINQLVPFNAELNFQCIGFKEIRYLPTDLGNLAISELHDYLDFLVELLPQCAIIYLTRDHDEVAKSAWWQTKDPDVVKKKLAAFELGLTDYSKSKSWVFPIDYTDMTERTPRLQALFNFLGAPYIEEQVDKVLSTKHSYSPKPDKLRKSLDYKLDLRPLDKVEHVSFDKLNISDEDNEFTVIRGVVVLNPSAGTGYQLVAKGPNGEATAEWNIPSPKMAQKFPENPYSQVSRFKIEGLQLRTGDSVKIFLVGDNDSHCLAILSVEGSHEV